jgi:hypothetical protein
LLLYVQDTIKFYYCKSLNHKVHVSIAYSPCLYIHISIFYSSSLFFIHFW